VSVFQNHVCHEPGMAQDPEWKKFQRDLLMLRVRTIMDGINTPRVTDFMA
jgi:hypothetical protein